MLGGIVNFNEEEWDQFIKEIDKDHDGTINFEEFQDMINSLVKKSTEIL